MALPQRPEGERGRLRRRRSHNRDMTGEEERELVERTQRHLRVLARVDGMYRQRARDSFIEDGTPAAAELYRECRRTVYNIMRANGEMGYQIKAARKRAGKRYPSS